MGIFYFKKTHNAVTGSDLVLGLVLVDGDGPTAVARHLPAAVEMGEGSLEQLVAPPRPSATPLSPSGGQAIWPLPTPWRT
jgi:hypothetical protein